ncbi:AraC family transcriptional regulator [Rhodocytophaga aerolata]|uniref:AraC family transcriptional regulator n=1 Tax=Rhodocytophaga aerolata TaxID=455078 RepID=A0ABT8RGQ3_9BACT|nr:AraC family transcriptional regulator [Rhodocytophaga aerolata]MDO1451277.1 AraC family transcriptional regulator [Rhodocytophaga aerolata]
MVKDIFLSQNIALRYIKIGEVCYEEKSDTSLEKIEQMLRAQGFEILTAQESTIISQVKQFVENDWVDGSSATGNLACLLPQKLGVDYVLVSRLFYDTEAIKLENYLLAKRIEKARYLVRHTNCSLTEIASKVGYSRVTHLSRDFKAITGMTPSYFKKLQEFSK